MVLILLFVSSYSFAQDPITGFRDWDFGLALETVEGDLVKAKNMMPGGKAFTLPDDDLNFEGKEVLEITYVFKKKKFNGVNILLEVKDLDYWIELYTEKYGEPKKVDMSFFINYDWETPTARLSFTHMPSKGDDGLSMSIMAKK